jgi:hypothetical protein
MMIRIGFDPGLDAQQEHQALIRQNELLRLAQDGMPQAPASHLNAYRILARLGREIAALGSSLETRYSASVDDQVVMNTQDSSSGCSS